MSGNGTEESDHATEDRHRIRRHPAAADGLVLGGLLADLATRICWSRASCRTPIDRCDGACHAVWFHTTLHETREAAAEVLGDRPFELWPVFGMPVADGINALAADQGAELIVFGSPDQGRSAVSCSATPPPRPATGRRVPSRSRRAASAIAPPRWSRP